MSNITELEPNDYHKGFLELVNEAFCKCAVKPVTVDEFNRWLEAVKSQDGHIFVLRDESESENGNVIATVKVLIERKMHNNFATMGHIEDVVVSKAYRKQGLGKQLIAYAQEYCKKRECYKTVLACRDDLEPFYKGCGAERRGIHMAI